MATTVTLHNVSASHGGACDCDDWHVQGPASTIKQPTLHPGQTARIDLSQLGWDQYEGQEFELAAICEGYSIKRHSSKVVYKLDQNYQFDWEGPSGNPKIVGP